MHLFPPTLVTNEVMDTINNIVSVISTNEEYIPIPPEGTGYMIAKHTLDLVH
jgi:hypothetical protein